MNSKIFQQIFKNILQFILLVPIGTCIPKSIESALTNACSLAAID